MLHGLGAPRIIRGNSLEQRLTEINDSDRVDVILTNPPFGGEEERGILSNFPEDKQTTEPALLFLQLVMRKLKVTPKPGRAAVVVPNGTLMRDGVGARIREELIREFNVTTVVRLPPGVFAPYASTHTNIIFFDRSGPTREVWYYGSRYLRTERPIPRPSRSNSRSSRIACGGGTTGQQASARGR